MELRHLTSMGVGGPAGRLVRASGGGGVARALAGVDRRGPGDLLVLGGGTNVIVSDEGFPGTVVVVDGGATSVGAERDGEVEVVADAGVGWDDLVALAVGRGLAGIELLSGIPGRVGAAPIQNIGAYGQQVCDVVDWVEVVDLATLEVSRLAGAGCGFAFRASRFKTDWRDRFAITRVGLRLAVAARRPPVPCTYADIERLFARTGGSPTDLAQRRQAVLATRRAKSMLADPSDPLAASVGSFFINPTVPLALAQDLSDRFARGGLPALYPEGHAGGAGEGVRRVPAAHLLRHSGFNPGDSWGPVRLSDRHVLAVVANPGATATDVWQVGHFVRHRVAEATGVTLAFEPSFVGTFPPFDLDAFLATYRWEPASGSQPGWLAAGL